MRRAPLPVGAHGSPQGRQSALGAGQFWLAMVWFAGRSCLLAVMMTTCKGCCCDSSSRSAASTIAEFTAIRAAAFTAIATPSAIRQFPRFMADSPFIDAYTLRIVSTPRNGHATKRPAAVTQGFLVLLS